MTITATPEQEPLGRINADGTYENIVELGIAVDLADTADPPQGHDPLGTQALPTIELRAVVTDPLGNTREMDGEPFERSPDGARLYWNSAQALPDQVVDCRLEVAARQVLRGPRCCTGVIRIDNRLPRPVAASPTAFENDRRASLLVSGNGFRGRTESDQATHLAFVRAVAAPYVDELRPDLPEDLDTLEWTRPLPPRRPDASIDGPTSLRYEVDINEALQGPERDERHVGPVFLVLRNPNGLWAVLRDPVVLHDPTTRFVGPFEALDGTPREVVLGHFVADPGALRDEDPLDAAVVTQESERITVFVGDGAGSFSQRMTVPLEEGVRPLGLLVTRRPDSELDDLRVVSTSETATEIDIVSFEGDQPRVGPASPSAGGALLPLLQLLEDGDAPFDLEVGDFDTDGLPDVAIVFHELDTVEIVLGDGSRETVEVRAPRGLAVANFDADLGGHSDLAVMCDRVDEAGVTRRTLVLFLRGEAGFVEECSLQIRSATGPIESSDAMRFDLDPYPEILVIRAHSSIKIRVVGPDEPPSLPGVEDPAFSLARVGGGSGPFALRATAVDAIRLPGGKRIAGGRALGARTLGMVTADDGFVAIMYADDDGLELDHTYTFGIPGHGRSLAVGDLDRDGRDDVVVVADSDQSNLPSTLTVLLGERPPLDENGDETTSRLERALLYRQGSSDGENPVITTELTHLAWGVSRAGASECSPRDEGACPDASVAEFLVTADRDLELVFVYLDPFDGRAVRCDDDRLLTERLRGFGDHVDLGSLITVNLDGENGDDVVVESGNAVFWARDRGCSLGSRFHVEGRLFGEGDVSAARPDDLGHSYFDIGRMASADIDGNGAPDLVLSMRKSHYAMLVLNPLQDRVVQFFRVDERPRGIDLVDLNGDGALDLLVACTKEDKHGRGRLDVLFGNTAALADPSEPFFFELDDDASAPIPALSIVGNGGGVETVHPAGFRTDMPFDQSPRFLVVANDLTVVAYPVRVLSPEEFEEEGVDPERADERAYSRDAIPGRVLQIGPPGAPLYDGVDPEEFVVTDLRERGTDLDLVVTDEDEGSIVVLRRFGDGWEAEVVGSIGNPKGIAWTNDDPARFAVVSRTRQQIILFEERAIGETSFQQKPPEHLVPPERVGTRAGFASIALADGVLNAFIVEDGNRLEQKPAVDLQYLPADLEPRELVRIRALDSRVERHPLLIDEPKLAADAVLLGDVVGRDNVPDLLLHEPKTGAVSIRMGRPCLLEECHLAEGFGPRVEGFSDGFDGPLVDWDIVELDRGPVLVIGLHDRVVVAAIDPDSGRGEILAEFTEFAEHTADGDLVSISAEELVSVSAGRALASGGAGCSAVGGLLIAATDGRKLYHAIGDDPPCAGTLVALDDVEGISNAVVTVADIHQRGQLDDILLFDVENDQYAGLTVYQAQEIEGVGFSPGLSVEDTNHWTDKPVDIAVFHANGDGLLDVAVGFRGGDVSVFIAIDDGEFRSPLPVFAGPGIEALASADVTGDEIDEILVSLAVPGFAVLTREGQNNP